MVFNTFSLPILGSVLTGTHEMIQGMKNLSDGKIQEGVQNLFFGMTKLNIPSNEGMTKWSLFLGTLATAKKGIQNLGSGLWEFNWNKTVAGIAQSILGLGGSVVITCLEAKTVREMSQIALLTTASGVFIVKGVKDISDGSYRKGLYNSLFGLSGLAISIFNIYHNYKIMTEEKVLTPIEQIEHFSLNYENELNLIYNGNYSFPNWKELGRGKSKIAYIHPKMQDFVIKFPLKGTELLDEFNNIFLAEEIINEREYKHISIPKTYLIEIQSGQVLFQKKFNLALNIYGLSTIKGNQVAVRELFELCREGHFCDILPGTNSAYLEGSEKDPILGIFDFDCRVYDSLEQKRNFEILLLQEALYLAKL